MEENKEKERYSYRQIRKVLMDISILYKWPFWRLIEKDGAWELKSRGWVHSIRDILIFPFWLIAGFCSGVIMVFGASAFERKIHWQGVEKPNKEQKRYIKRRLLMN